MITGLWLAALWRIPSLPGPWGVPDGLLIAVLAWALRPRRSRSGVTPLWVGATLGLLKDLASGGPFGLWTAIFAVTAWVAHRASRLIEQDHPVTQGAWVAVFAAGATLAYAAFLALQGNGGVAGAVLWYFLLPSALATAVVSLGLFPILRRLLVPS